MIKIIKHSLSLAALLLCTILMFSSCSQSTVEHTFFAMDTVMTFKLYGASDKDICSEAEQKLRLLERDFSKNDKGGSVNIINSGKAGEYSLDSDLCNLLRTSFELSASTDGALNVACAPLTELWRIGKSDFSPPSENDINSVLPLVLPEVFELDGENLIKKNDDSGLDLGAVGKGYAADALVELLGTKSEGGVISLGGNIALYGKRSDRKPWRIALKNPLKPDESLGTFVIEGENSVFISVTGGYERYSEYNGKRYIHVLDTKKGYPADSDLAGVCVISDNGTLADALSTALFVMGSKASLEFYEQGQYEFEAVMTKSDGETLLTPGLAESGEFIFND